MSSGRAGGWCRIGFTATATPRQGKSGCPQPHRSDGRGARASDEVIRAAGVINLATLRVLEDALLLCSVYDLPAVPHRRQRDSWLEVKGTRGTHGRFALVPSECDQPDNAFDSLVTPKRRMSDAHMAYARCAP